MDFEFFAPGVEAGFVEYVNNGFTAAVKVSNGRGSRTQTHTFNLRNLGRLSEITPEDRDRFIRHAITRVLQRAPLSQNVTHAAEDLDQSLPVWTGDVVPYPKSS